MSCHAARPGQDDPIRIAQCQLGTLHNTLPLDCLGPVHDVEVVLLVLLREDLVCEGEIRREEGLSDLNALAADGRAGATGAATCVGLQGDAERARTHGEERGGNEECRSAPRQGGTMAQWEHNERRWSRQARQEKSRQPTHSEQSVKPRSAAAPKTPPRRVSPDTKLSFTMADDSPIRPNTAGTQPNGQHSSPLAKTHTSTLRPAHCAHHHDRQVAPRNPAFAILVFYFRLKPIAVRGTRPDFEIGIELSELTELPPLYTRSQIPYVYSPFSSFLFTDRGKPTFAGNGNEFDKVQRPKLVWNARKVCVMLVGGAA